MTYGYWLDRAGEALADARVAATGDRAASHADAAAAVAARTRLYHGLIRLTGLIADTTPAAPTVAEAEHLVNTASRARAADPARLLVTGLSVAAGAAPTGPPAAGVVATQLARAADAVAVASDILASHIGAGLPRTLEGRMISLGVGRDAGLAEIASLTLSAVEVDRRLPAWLTGRGTPRGARALHQGAVERIRWWTASNYPPTLTRLAGHRPGRSLLRGLDVAPATEPSAGPAPVTGLADVAGALEVMRAWLVQHPHRAGIGHLDAAAALGLAIGTTLVRTGCADAGELLRRWDLTAQLLSRYGRHPAVGQHPIVDQTRAAAAWLRVRSRPPAGTPGPAPDWRDELSTLATRLPGLATAMQGALRSVAARGELYLQAVVPRLGSATHGGIRHIQLRWVPVHPDHDTVRLLLHRLGRAATEPGGSAAVAFPAPPDPTAQPPMQRPQPPDSAPGRMPRRDR